MIVNLNKHGGENPHKPPEYTVLNGTPPSFSWENSDHTNWRMIFRDPCTIQFKKLNNAKFVDVFVLGSGGNGAKGAIDEYAPGGSGAPSVTKYSRQLSKKSYSIYIAWDGSSFDGIRAGRGEDGRIDPHSGGVSRDVQAFGSGTVYGKAGSTGYYTSAGGDWNGADASERGCGGDGGKYGQSRPDNIWHTGYGGYGSAGLVIIRNSR